MSTHSRPTLRAKDEQAKMPAILFDLDGTLIDSNYEHVAAWRLALRRVDIEAPNAFLHRCIDMRGDLLVKEGRQRYCREVRKTSQNQF